MPKPFLPLVNETTMFQQALHRCRAEFFGPPVIVTGDLHHSLVEEQLGQADVGSIIIEPEARQTAAAVALAALRLAPETIMIVCPTDHHVTDVAAFRSAAQAAAALAREGWLVCLGMRATHAETRFGYIRPGEPLEARSDAFRVARFVEKPDSAAARAFVDSGDHLWNAGIFAFRASDYLEELERCRPEIASRSRDAVADGELSGRNFRPAQGPFAQIEPESIDYAIMQQSERVAVVAADMGWSDVGDWRALYRLREKDEAGNSVRGPAELIDCNNILVDSDGPKVHVVGLADVVIVVDGEDVLVASSAALGSVGKLGRSEG